MRTNYSNKFVFYFFLILILFLPFQIFLSEVMTFRTGLSESIVFWLLHWYEIVLPLVALVVIVNYLKGKDRKIDLVGFSAVVLVLLGIITILFSPYLFIALESFRFSFLSVVLFLLAHLYFKSIDSRVRNNQNTNNEVLINTYLIVAFLIALMAILERFLPTYYWVNLGLINPDSGFGYGPRLAGSFVQSGSIIGGPNQLASYLLPALFMLIFRTQQTKNYRIQINGFFQGIKSRIMVLFPPLLIFLAIVLTSSRSAIVGVLAGLLISALFYSRNYVIKVATLFFIGIVGLLFFIASNSQNENLRDFVNHGTSQKLHHEAFMNFKADFAGWSMTEKLVGQGMGLSGPVALKYAHGTIPESWYLQLIIEFGVLGLSLWLIFVALLIWRMIQIGDRGLMLSLISISVVALFLHTWADNPVIAYTLFILLGSVANDKKTNY